ncbi:hypothetical protein [Weissella confusa]|uniref:hypothetical protein n=1 Tax=Weissella confusa TaxID=1583 RepID=UPI00223B43D4|nr:hypothetical protein [Weissella confusa]MCT0022453.1 hypothetical protein [Weissella confusa]
MPKFGMKKSDSTPIYKNGKVLDSLDTATLVDIKEFNAFKEEFNNFKTEFNTTQELVAKNKSNTRANIALGASIIMPIIIFLGDYFFLER